MKKNILIVIDKLDYHGSSINGPARYYSWLLKEIDKDKFNIWFCSLRKQGPSHELFAGSNMLYLGHHKYYPFSFIDIIKLVKKYNIQLLHLSGYASETFGRLAALYTKTPVIIQEHWVDPDFGGIIKLVEKRLSNATTRAVAISELSKDFLIKQKGIPEEKVEIIKNGIPLSKFNIASKESGLELKKSLGLDLTKKVVGIVGMLHENKGHSLFIQAAKQVIDSYGEDVYFVIVGEGELREQLEAEILAKGIQSLVLLVGQQSDMPAVFQMLDIFTICSYVENAPLSLMEAMASGRPIVTTDCGGPGEMIRSGENGVVVPVGDSKVIADGIITLLGNDKYCENLGTQARNDSFNYDISRVAREFEYIYDDVI